MALTDLLQALEADAAAELERARADADVDAREIREQARRDAAALERRLARAGDEDVRREAVAIVATARLEAAASVRAAREDAWHAVTEALVGELADARAHPDWTGHLSALAREAQAALPEATDLHVDPRDRGLLAAAANGRRVHSDLDTDGGVILVDPYGRRVDNTLETRLSAAEPALRRRLAQLLAADLPSPSEAGA